MDKVNAAKTMIRDLAGRIQDAPLLIMFSGGKDSLTVALLAREAGVRPELVFMESSIDLPGSIEKAVYFANQLDMVLHRSNPARDYYGDFTYWVRRVGYFPTVQKNWCSGRLKIRPFRAYYRRLFGLATTYKLTGVRREESARRRRLYEASALIVPDREHQGTYLAHVILDWTDGDVISFLESRGMLQANPLYAQVGVSGCYWCPYYQESLLERIARAFPGIYRPIIELERELRKPALMDHKFLYHLVERVEAQIPLFEF